MLMKSFSNLQISITLKYWHRTKLIIPENRMPKSEDIVACIKDGEKLSTPVGKGFGKEKD